MQAMPKLRFKLVMPALWLWPCLLLEAVFGTSHRGCMHIFWPCRVSETPLTGRGRLDHRQGQSSRKNASCQQTVRYGKWQFNNSFGGCLQSVWFLHQSRKPAVPLSRKTQILNRSSRRQCGPYLQPAFRTAARMGQRKQTPPKACNHIGSAQK